MTAINVDLVRRAVEALDALPFDLATPDKSSPWRDVRSARDRLLVLAELDGGYRALGDLTRSTGLGRSAVDRHRRALLAAEVITASPPAPSTPECAFPGCDADAVAPSKYCAREEHNPKTAMAERKWRTRKPLPAPKCACGPRAVVDAENDCARCGRRVVR